MPVLKSDFNDMPLCFTAVLRGTLAAVVISVLGSAVLGLVYYFTGLKEGTLPLLATGVFLLGVFVGGGMAAQYAGVRGLYHGLAVALAFFVISWLITGLLLPSPIILSGLLQKLLLCLGAGAVGGVLGVSLAV